MGKMQANMPGRMLPMARVDLDSTELREQLSQGEAKSEAFPKGVLERIRKRSLYQS